MEFENRRGTDVEIIAARLIHYNIAGGERDSPAEVSPPDYGNLGGTELRVGGDVKPLNNSIGLEDGQTEPVEIGFRYDEETGQPPDYVYEPADGDWFFLFLAFQENENEFSGTYIVAPTGQ